MFGAREVARAHGGVCTAADLLAAGVSRPRIAAAVEHGEVERLRRGVFADPGVPAEVKRAVRVGGRLACVSAAGLHGLRVLNVPHELHVDVDAHATRLRHPDDSSRRLLPGEASAGVRLHWARGGSTGGTLVSLEECLVQMFTCLPELEVLCALDSARERVDWMPEAPAARRRRVRSSHAAHDAVASIGCPTLDHGEPSSRRNGGSGAISCGGRPGARAGADAGRVLGRPVDRRAADLRCGGRGAAHRTRRLRSGPCTNRMAEGGRLRAHLVQPSPGPRRVGVDRPRGAHAHAARRSPLGRRA
ncbi:hypothetical protein ESP51_05900 [Agromyces albus]|uniref:AbiEi antitoxin N-terminal domain-containing protein n=1 Tax=Agromyces albus TaxID=205332 RepID=A0A4Q2L232_9MICO|nr:hypothetical protein ESP51_19235 [Agromyces albus]RXZ72145.1 hypothetical protein ESP51_05900 [Agromyces albus]